MKNKMICLNANNDSNDSAISYSPLSLSSSPVKSSAIKQLLESPIIKSNGLEVLSQLDVDSDTDPEGDDTLDEIICAESPEPSPVSSQERTGVQIVADSQQLDIEEVAATQMAVSSQDKESDCSAAPQSPQSARNTFRRQSSVCVSNLNANITSSPRALAILKNAIKTSYSNRSCDKINNNNNNHICDDLPLVADNGRNVIESANGLQSSPPKSNIIRNSPFSRGSAILRAAKERLERQEIERSPKISYNYESNKLTSILRKHELQSSPTSCGEPKAKKKKVLFAEPVVSSELTFGPSPTQPDVQPIDVPFNELLKRGLEEMNDKKRNNLVHQNSEFDKEFDNDSNDSDSPLMLTQQYFSEDELNEQMCGQQHNPVVPVDDDDPLSDSPDSSLLPFKRPNGSESESSEEPFMCAQRFPDDSGTLYDQNPNTVGIQTDFNDCLFDEPIVNVPIRLSLIKELYNLFGDLIQQYTDS